MEKIKEALEIITRKINDRCPWMVIAGANLVIRGIRSETKDLDIVTTKDGLEIFRKKFKKSIIHRDRSGKSQNHVAEDFNIYGLDVEVIYDFAVTNYTESLLNGLTEFYDFGTFRVRLLKLEQEKEGYRKIGTLDKLEKAKEIEDYLKSKNKVEEMIEERSN